MFAVSVSSTHLKFITKSLSLLPLTSVYNFFFVTGAVSVTIFPANLLNLILNAERENPLFYIILKNDIQHNDSKGQFAKKYPLPHG